MYLYETCRLTQGAAHRYYLEANPLKSFLPKLLIEGNDSVLFDFLGDRLALVFVSEEEDFEYATGWIFAGQFIRHGKIVLPGVQLLLDDFFYVHLLLGVTVFAV